MANGTRPFPLLIALVVGAAVGWFIGHRPPPPTLDCPEAKHHLIEVGPTAAEVSEPRAAISRSKNHKVFWISKDDKKDLTITFKPENFPSEANGEPPFEGGENGKPQEIKCNAGGVCKAGRVNDKLKLPGCPKTFNYKYWQKLSDASGVDEKDAWIIIEK